MNTGMNSSTDRPRFGGLLGWLTPHRVSKLAVAIVAAVAAVVSYAHMQQVAQAAGEGWRSHLLPLSVDGLLIAAAMSMVVARLHGKDPSPLAWLALTLGIVASLAANVAAAEPTWEARLVAAWSPLALALALELLMQQIRRATPTAPQRSDTASATAAAPPRAPAPPAPRSTGAAPTVRATPAKRADRGARNGKTGRAAGGQERARRVFERAVAEGRADELTGADLAREVGASAGAARKWLAVFRADQHTTTTTTYNGAANDDRDADGPRLAVVGESYAGSEAR